MINEIICGDNIEVLSGIEGGSIDLTVTSPPYDSLRDYGGYSWDFEGLVEQLNRVTADGGVVVWVVNDATVKGSETGTSFRQALHFIDAGFRLHDTMIYEKSNPVPSVSNRYQPSFEYMFVFSKEAPKTFNPIKVHKKYQENRVNTSFNRAADGKHVKGNTSADEFRLKRNVWTYSVGKHHSSTDAIAFEHPAIFPEQLAEDHILSWSNEGDIVLDPFVGSGTTAKMALLNNRKYIGIDISEEYCEIARQRVKVVVK